MPTKRLNINLTNEEDVEELEHLATELQFISKKKMSYVDVIRLLVKYGRAYPNTILTNA